MVFLETFSHTEFENQLEFYGCNLRHLIVNLFSYR